MGKLGEKLSKAFSSIGNKTNKMTNTIGKKTNSVVKEVKGVARVLDSKAGQVANTASNAFNDTKQFVNKLPQYNEKAIQLGNTIVKKSGGITDVLRKGAGITDKLVNGIADLGGKDIPVVGSLLGVAGRASHQLSVGAKKLDSARDSASNKLDKYGNVSRSTIGDIEKINQRKKMEMAIQAQDVDTQFA